MSAASAEQARVRARAGGDSARAREGAKRPSKQRPRAPLGNKQEVPQGPADGCPCGGQDCGPDCGEAARARRTERRRLRRALRKITSLDRLRACGRVTLTGTGGPTLRAGGQAAAGYAGLVTCRSVWVCPVCAAKIAAERAADLAVVLERVHAEGGCGYLVTLTMAHELGYDPADMWAALSGKGGAWDSAVNKGGAPKDLAGLLGWCKIVEATHSWDHGWHLHVHALLCFSADVDEITAQRIAIGMWRRWDRALRRQGYHSSLKAGVTAERVRPGDNGLAEYFVKISREVTSSYAKDSRSGRSPFAIARDAIEHGEKRDIALWRQWEQASRGHQQMTWSQESGRYRDLREFAGIRTRSDEEIAEEEADGEDLIGLTRETWSEIGDTEASDELVTVTDREGITGACAWLDARGLSWVPVKKAKRTDRGHEHPADRIRREARAVLRVLPRPG